MYVHIHPRSQVRVNVRDWLITGFRRPTASWNLTTSFLLLLSKITGFGVK